MVNDGERPRRSNRTDPALYNQFTKKRTILVTKTPKIEFGVCTIFSDLLCIPELSV